MRFQPIASAAPDSLLTIDRQTGRGRTAQFNAVPKDCGAIGHSFQRLCGGGEERRGAKRGGAVGPSLTFNAAVKYGVPQSGKREGRDDDCDRGLISLAKCVLSDPPAAAPLASARTVVYFHAVGSGAVEGSREMAPFNVTQI